jgi:hypothetical protein
MLPQDSSTFINPFRSEYSATRICPVVGVKVYWKANTFRLQEVFLTYSALSLFLCLFLYFLSVCGAPKITRAGTCALVHFGMQMNIDGRSGLHNCALSDSSQPLHFALGALALAYHEPHAIIILYAICILLWNHILVVTHGPRSRAGCLSSRHRIN